MCSSFISITILETYAKIVPNFLFFIISVSIVSAVVGLITVITSFFHISYLAPAGMRIDANLTQKSVYSDISYRFNYKAW